MQIKGLDAPGKTQTGLHLDADRLQREGIGTASGKGIPLEKAWADLEGHWEKQDGQEVYHVDVRLRVRGDLSEKDMRRITAAAEACPAHKIVAKGAVIRMQVEKV